MFLIEETDYLQYYSTFKYEHWLKKLSTSSNASSDNYKLNILCSH